MFNNKVVIKLFHSFFFFLKQDYLHYTFILKHPKNFMKKKNKITLFLEKKYLNTFYLIPFISILYNIFVLFFKIILILTNYIFTE